MPKIIAQVTETIEEIEEEQPLEIVQEKQYIVPEQVFSQVQQPAPIVKKVRKKRTMTPEMLEKLAVARAKEIQEEKKRPVVNNVTNEYKTINNNITQEDIQKIALETSAKATAQALYEYEKIRKERKEEKKIKKEQEAKLQERQNTIKKSIIGGYAGDYKSNKKSIYG